MKKTVIAFIILFVLLFIWDRLLKNQQKYSIPENQNTTNTNNTQEDLQTDDKNIANNNINSSSTNLQKAPDFSLISLNKNEIKLSNYRGKVIILDFWATWCPPCRAEIPFFIELYKQYKEQGLAIIGVATSDEKNKVEAFAKNYKINYPVVMGNEKIVEDYGGIRGLPTTFIIDKEGNIREKFIGYRPKEVFEEVFLKLK